ncbi:hypothetical protein ACQJBY_037898 [Aegilops geniculata]
MLKFLDVNAHLPPTWAKILLEIRILVLHICISKKLAHYSCLWKNWFSFSYAYKSDRRWTPLFKLVYGLAECEKNLVFLSILTAFVVDTASKLQGRFILTWRRHRGLLLLFVGWP